MTELDEADARVARRATGALRELNRRGVLGAADVHVAQRLAALGGETDERVLVAAALAVRAVRAGSVCVPLEELLSDGPVPDWRQVLGSSVLAGEGGPLRVDGDALYLDRYWRQETEVLQAILDRELAAPPVVDVDRLRTDLARLTSLGGVGMEHAQQLAAVTAAAGWTTVIAGGPGTGKTTTVARLLALLVAQGAQRIALAAPTGKAAARMQEAVQQQVGSMAAADQHGLDDLTASTIHRLLGSRPGSGERFRHDRDDPLPYDIVVVDETSMLSLTLMARLLEAVRPDARLIFIGDPGQLASVEAGAVLGDLVDGLKARPARSPAVLQRVTDALGSAPRGEGWKRGVVELDVSHRLDDRIGRLAAAIRAGDADGAIDQLTAGGVAVRLADPDDAGVWQNLAEHANALRSAAESGDAALALEVLGRHRLLCAHRTGPAGVHRWNRLVEDLLENPRGGDYAGRPLLVTANDHGLRLFNGDTGVVVTDDDGALRAVFAQGQELRRFAPARLSAVETAHAMTVHKSQGSEFDGVTVVLPSADSPLLTREILYTALTRARHGAVVVGTADAVRAAVGRRARRASGLARRLAEAPTPAVR
ncbi:exodeoxyribonuclease V subunit alpha [Cellulomonas sp. P5_C6]